MRVYESRSSDAPAIASGVILTPNGLLILDRLGVLARIKSRCYVTTHRVFKNGKDETIRKSQTSGEPLYEYANHRIWRSILLDEMKQMLAERSVRIQYSAKFNCIVSDTADGVDFRMNNEILRASLLVGMDGIYSTVRKHLAPDVTPEYTGTVAVLSHIKRASVSWPYDDYELNATIQDKPGAIFFIAEDPRGEDIMIGKQKKSPEYSRDQLERLQENKDKLVEFYREDYDKWGFTAKSIIDQVAANKQECFIWPFLKVPTLARWFSDSGRVLLCGDGAHGLPPSSGQGINQALEDVYSLTLLLVATDRRMEGSSRADIRLLDALEYWQCTRQQRVDAVFDWATNSTNVQRMSEDERQKLIAEGNLKETTVASGDDMNWLYRSTLEQDIRNWIADRA